MIKCAKCEAEFKPANEGQRVCSFKCARALTRTKPTNKKPRVRPSTAPDLIMTPAEKEAYDRLPCSKNEPSRFAVPLEALRALNRSCRHYS